MQTPSKTRTMASSLLLTLLSLSVSSSAAAQDIRGGVGQDQLASFSLSYMPEGTKTAEPLYRFHAESSVFIIPTARNNTIAIDYEASFGLPYEDFFGFFDARLGMRMPLIQSRWLRLGLSLGVGLGAHMYAWAQPRLSVSFPGFITVEGAYLFVPGQASHRWGQDFFEGERGQAHRRARISAFLNTPISNEYDEIGYTTRYALCVFAEHHDLGGPDDPDDRAIPGKYTAFGFGVAF